MKRKTKSSPKKNKGPRGKQDQSSAFIAKAKELGYDDNPATFKAVIGKIAPPVRIAEHASDCAVHDAPAMKPGRCTCGVVKPRK